MTSSRLILIFLGFIFLIIVILSSKQIAKALRDRFGRLLPAAKVTTEEIAPTPTIIEAETPTPTPETKEQKETTSVKEVPATGPNDMLWIVLGGSLIAGITLKKFTTLSLPK